MSKTPLNRRDWIAGLEHGLAVLEAFDHEHARLTASQLALLTGLSRSAARRYLLTLEHLGYLSSDGKLFGLTPRVLRMGWSYFESARLPRIVQPYMQQLSAKLNESCYLSVMDEWELSIIARSGGPRVMASGFVLGARVPPVLTSFGIVLLAWKSDSAEVARWLDTQTLAPFTPFTMTVPGPLLDRLTLARKQGYAVIEQQLQVGVRGIAVPLKNRRGEVVAALSTSMPIGNESEADALARVLPAMHDTALSMLNVL